MKLTAARHHLLGYVAAFAVTLIWATWLVASRSGAQSALTAYDLMALRYGISGLVALPIVLYYKPWRHMTLVRIVVVSILLGPMYTLCVYAAFSLAPASHGGVFMNGALPAITLFMAWIFFGNRAHRLQYLGLVMILAGAGMAASDGANLSLKDVWMGDFLFLLAGISFAAYLVFARKWQVSATQVLMCASVVNCIWYVPIWLVLLPTGIHEVESQQLLLQILYQGLIPSLAGLLLVAYATRNIGPSATAAFMAAVPALAALLGAMFLGEILGFIGWFSLLVLTPGILLVAFNASVDT